MMLSSLFTDGCVLQRDQALPVWGWASPGERVTVRLAGKEAAAAADAQGKWRVTLPALPAGGPHELTVTGTESLVVRDVLVGEVWVGSGQSNMQMTTTQVVNGEQEVAAADHPHIRLFTVPNVAGMKRLDRVDARWKLCSPKTAGPFSAVAYFFGRELHQKLNVPVGLIDCSWGGTLAEAWTSREALLAEPSLRGIVEDLDQILAAAGTGPTAGEEALRAWEEANRRQDPANAGYGQGWADPAVPAQGWATMNLPAYWQTRGLKLNGVVWFRKEVDVPASWAGQDLTLSLGHIDKSDTSYFNNQRVGGISLADREDAWDAQRVYTVSGRHVKAGRNVIAVRVFSHVWAGGIVGKDQELYLAPAKRPGDGRISLIGPWQYQVEADFGFFPGPPALPLGPGNPNTPTTLFNSMVWPLLPFGIRGAIWYQGESNAPRARQYRTLFPTMIRDWRKHWGQDPSTGSGQDFPFYFVQLANYRTGTDVGSESPWAELREAQTMALRLPQTGMAVTIDIGEATDIHPRNKQDVGKRLALNALALTYGVRNIDYSGPIYREARVEKNAIRIRFDHVAGGLVSKELQLPSFIIAGADRRFVAARAVIDGDTVLVSSPEVPAPVAVRYGWADDPVCTLCNRAGLPASPFRTDGWE